MVSSTAWIRLVLVLLGIMTAGMASVALLQLATLRSLEEADGGHLSRRKAQEGRSVIISEVSGAVPRVPDVLKELWSSDPQAKLLRLGLVRPEVVSWTPRIVVFHNFLSDEECQKMVDLGKPHLSGSTVVDVKTGKGIKSQGRTSSGMFLTQGDRKRDFVKAIEQRIAVHAQVPVENGEAIQILRYEKQQEYHPHFDYFSDEFNLKRGGQRVATVLMYLRQPEEGGETIFPKAGKGECMCGGERKKGLCVPATKGDAVLFWSVKLDGSTDPASLHGSCPTLRGEKWSATKWMRQGVFL